MTQTSYFWDGLVVGDGTLARYDRNELAAAFSSAFGSNGANGFVVPRIGGSAAVTASTPAAASVVVASGEAWVKGWRWVSDAAETLAIAANVSGNPRIDRIVLQISWLAQTVRLAVIQGTPGAAPALPGLTQVYGTTWEVPLAYVWVANGFATIANEEIHDEREFLATALEMAYAHSQKNLLVNSEFIACSEFGAGLPTRPFGWTYAGAGVATIASVAKPAQQTRGRALRYTATGAGQSFSQTFAVKASTVYVIKGLMNVTTAYGALTVTTNSAAPGTITKYARRVGAWVEETIVYTTEADATTMTVTYNSVANLNVVSFGQCMALEGYIAGAFRTSHEYISFGSDAVVNAFLVDAAWSDTAKSSGTTNINMLTGFGAGLTADVVAVHVFIRARDSASAAAANCSLQLNCVTASYQGVWVYLEGVTNDKWRSNSGIVDIQDAAGARTLRVEVLATGAGTLDARISVTGVFT